MSEQIFTAEEFQKLPINHLEQHKFTLTVDWKVAVRVVWAGWGGSWDMTKLVYDPNNINGDAFNIFNHTWLLHWIKDPLTEIITISADPTKIDIEAFTYYCKWIKKQYSWWTSINPWFWWTWNAVDRFAYIGINPNQTINIKVSSAFTPAEIESGIIEIWLVRSIVWWAWSTINFAENSPYLLEDLMARKYLRSKFEWTSYDRTAFKVYKSTTPLQFNYYGGNYMNWNDVLKEATALENFSWVKVHWDTDWYVLWTFGTLVADTTNYNPGNGLEAIPAWKFISVTLLHSSRNDSIFYLHGRELYDTYAEALSAEEELGPVEWTILADVNAITTVALKQWEVTIRETSWIKDIRHSVWADNQPTLTSWAQNISTIFNGSVVEKFEIQYVEDTWIIYAEVQKSWGWDLTFQLDWSSYNLDCTTWTWTWWRARIALTPGTATAEQLNYIYINLVLWVWTLQSATTKPAWDIAIIWETNIFTAARFLTDGKVMTGQQFNNAASISGQGFITRSANKARIKGPDYISGLDPTLTITTVWAWLDTIWLSSTAGQASQFNEQTVDAFDSTAWFIVLNHPTIPRLFVSSLADIDVDAQWNTLRANWDKYWINIIYWINSWTDDVRYALLPNGKYSDETNAINDVDNLSITSVSTGLVKTSLRTYRVVLRYNSTNWGTFINLMWGNNVQLQRGFPIGQGWGWSGWSSQSTFSDGAFNIFNSLDAWKILQFSAAWITTGNTRTYTAPDKNGTLALLDDLTPKQDVSEKWQANWYAWLDGSWTVPAAQLPSYVDDVLEFADFASLPGTWETWKIYVTLDDNLTYRWSWTIYVELSPSSAVWGQISWTLANQTDLQNALDWKVSTTWTETIAWFKTFSNQIQINNSLTTQATTITNAGFTNILYINPANTNIEVSVITWNHVVFQSNWASRRFLYSNNTPDNAQELINKTALDNAIAAVWTLPTGWTTWQVLAKVDWTDFNTEWIDPAWWGGGWAWEILANVEITWATVNLNTPTFAAKKHLKIIFSYQSKTDFALPRMTFNNDTWNNYWHKNFEAGGTVGWAWANSSVFLSKTWSLSWNTATSTELTISNLAWNYKMYSGTSVNQTNSTLYTLTLATMWWQWNNAAQITSIQTFITAWTMTWSKIIVLWTD